MDKRRVWARASSKATSLAKLRDEPDCAGVTAVSIVAGHRLGSSETWKVVDWKGEADDVAVESGLKAVYDKFAGQYDIAS